MFPSEIITLILRRRSLAFDLTPTACEFSLIDMATVSTMNILRSQMMNTKTVCMCLQFLENLLFTVGGQAIIKKK